MRYITYLLLCLLGLTAAIALALLEGCAVDLQPTASNEAHSYLALP